MKIFGMLLLLCGMAVSAAATPVAAPEIDTSSATSAVAFLAGSVMILRSKLRK